MLGPLLLLMSSFACFAQQVAINLGTYPSGQTVPPDTIISTEWSQLGITFSARAANEAVGQQGSVRPIAAGSGPGPCGRRFFFTPDVLGAVGIFRFVVPGTNTSTDATYFEMSADFDASTERVELVGFNSGGVEVARMNLNSPGVGSIPLSIAGRFRFAELRTFGNPGISFNGVACRPVIFRSLQESQGTIQNVTRAMTGAASNGFGNAAHASGNGRFVAFDSDANDLVPGDTNGFSDVFVRDLQTNALIRVSVSNNGVQGNGDSYVTDIGSDGRFVVFESDATNLRDPDNNGSMSDVFIADILPFTTGSGGTFLTRVTNGNGAAWGGQVGGSPGRLAIAYVSEASNEVAGDSNGLADVFVRDIIPVSRVRRASLRPNGAQITTGDIIEMAMSQDARFLVFTTDSPHIVPGVGNGYYQVFHVDNVDSIFNPGWLPVNRHLSRSPNGITGDSDCYSPRVSDAGHAVFVTDATNIVPGDTNGTSDAFLCTYRGLPQRLSVGPGGAQTGSPGDLGAWVVDISDGAPVCVFDTDVPGIVAGDGNATCDTFVGMPGSYTRVTHWDRAEIASGTYQPTLSSDGLHVTVFALDLSLPFNQLGTGPFIVDFNRSAREGGRTPASVEFEYRCEEDEGLYFVVALALAPLPGTIMPSDTRVLPLSQIAGGVLFAATPMSGARGALTIPIPPPVFGSGFVFWAAAATIMPPGQAANGVKGLSNPVRFRL